MRRRHEAGFSIVELSFSFVILVTIALALVSHTSSVYQRDAKQKARVFAYQKASSLLSELQSYVNRSEDSSANSLNVFDDGTGHNPVLTILKEGNSTVAPNHPMSGNRRGPGYWKWARRITVRPFPGIDNRNVRYVTVRIYQRKHEGGYERLADLSGVVNSVGSAYPPTQVFDVYLLALENIPGWWVHMDAIKPFVESSITDLEARNPGVRFRTHWITKSSYGRNQLYTPFINETVDSRQPIPGVYMYPGLMPNGSASTYYYVPHNMKGRILVDGVLRNGYDATSNRLPYAFADRFNNAMRLEDERAYFDARVAQGLEDPATPTWRLLLEDMCGNPDKYHNAIVVNLHGELLPLPSVRNYSDAAKEPASHSGLRVVTHGERLRFVRGDTVAASEDVNLRVYAYRTNPDTATNDYTNGQPVTLQVMNVNLTGNVNGTGVGTATLEIERLQGGVDRGDGNRDYSDFARAPTSAGYGSDMYYDVAWIDNSTTTGEKYTRIRLYNTPSKAPEVDDKGLASDQRLYGWEYIPCSTESDNDFSTTLASDDDKPKNTARWRIRIPKQVLGLSGTGLGLSDHVLAVRTRIGNDVSTGRAFPTPHQPENLSATYVYWTNDVESVPHTERYQFNGDPRHCPYADLKHNGASFSNGYNWFWDSFVNGTQNARSRWPGFDPSRLFKGWRGRVEVDYGRYAQLIRKAITRSEAIYTTLTGFSYYYIGLGNEIGADSANGYPNSIPVSTLPYGGSSGWSYVQAIGSGSGLRSQKLVRAVGSSGSWWGRYWLGELYPDSAHALWSAAGNLPSGGVAGRFYRAHPDSISWDMPYGTRLFRPHRTTATEGCTSIFNTGTDSSTFHHVFSHDWGSIQTAGQELAANYNFPLPSRVWMTRPFGLNLSYHGWHGEDWWKVSDYPRYSTTIERTFYRHDRGYEGSALVGLTRPGGDKTGHVVVNGLANTVESGSAFIAKYAVLSLLQSYFDAGHPSITNNLTLPPRVEIKSPTEITELNGPTSINVAYGIQWRRWDGRKYGSWFSDSFTGNESELVYVLMYSNDGGTTFRYMQDNSVVPQLGQRPTNSTYIVGDGGPGDETYAWSVPASTFPEGSYVIRVECYRNSEQLHYANHQVKVFLQR